MGRRKILSGKILTKTTNDQTTSISLLLTFAPQGVQLRPGEVKGQRHYNGDLVSLTFEKIKEDSHQSFTENAPNCDKQGNKTEIEHEYAVLIVAVHLWWNSCF